jgi:hypothetical protein
LMVQRFLSLYQTPRVAIFDHAATAT